MGMLQSRLDFFRVDLLKVRLLSRELLPAMKE
jgi:hypothetical protein